MLHACGVDFGTSNSTVGYYQSGITRLLPLEQDKLTLPSVVFYNHEEDTITYGREALSAYLEGYEGRLMRSMKSLLGSSLIDGQTEVQGRAVPFRDLLSHYIGELKRRAEHTAGQTFEQAVFGRPVHFVDDDTKADLIAQQTLEQIAHSVGFKEVYFQFEPIAAAIDYESRIEKEELVLIADIGGGTSDFSLVRLSPDRHHLIDRQNDILGNGGVHIGGTDFDKYLSLSKVMPLLGLGGQFSNGTDMPSSYYFNLATWHTINLTYSQKVTRELQDLQRDVKNDANNPLHSQLNRLLHLIDQRDGHWLAMQAEEAKILLSNQDQISLLLDRLSHVRNEQKDCFLDINQTDFQESISHLMQDIEKTITYVLRCANVKASSIDTIFFTGGSSGVRGLRNRIAAMAPSAKVVEGDLFGSIGTGLGLDAFRRFK